MAAAASAASAGGIGAWLSTWIDRAGGIDGSPSTWIDNQAAVAAAPSAASARLSLSAGTRVSLRSAGACLSLRAAGACVSRCPAGACVSPCPAGACVSRSPTAPARAPTQAGGQRPPSGAHHPGLVCDQLASSHERAAQIGDPSALSGARAEREVDCPAELVRKIAALAPQRRQMGAQSPGPVAAVPEPTGLTPVSASYRTSASE